MNDARNTSEQTGAGWRRLSKRRVFLTHLAVSATIVGIVCALIFAIWYPGPYFTIKGAWNVLRVLIGVDLILGPLLTLILYRPGKPGLAIDMTMIAMIQFAALLYGTSVIYQERPYYAVFAVDRFEVLSRRDVDPSAVAELPFAKKPLAGPALVYAMRPSDPAEFQRLLQETVFEGKPDLERRPRYWRPYDDNRGAVLERAGRLGDLAAQRPEFAAAVARTADALGEDPAEIPYVPAVGNGRALILVLDPRTAVPRRALEINPWDG